MKLKDYHKKKQKTKHLHSFIIKYFNTTYVHTHHDHHLGITTMTLIWRKHNANSVYHAVIKVKFSFFPPSSPLMTDMSSQLHSTKTTKSHEDNGIGNMVRTTSLLPKPYCCWVCFGACCGVCMFLHTTSKVHSQQRPDMGRGGHVRWQCWTDNSFLLIV